MSAMSPNKATLGKATNNTRNQAQRVPLLPRLRERHVEVNAVLSEYLSAVPTIVCKYLLRQISSHKVLPNFQVTHQNFLEKFGGAIA